MMRYEVRVNYKPEIHDDCMAYYWQIVLITEDGVFTVQHGWDDDIDFALLAALDWADENIEE